MVYGPIKLCAPLYSNRVYNSEQQSIHKRVYLSSSSTVNPLSLWQLYLLCATYFWCETDPTQAH